MWRQNKNILNDNKFEGVTFDHMGDLEKCYSVKIIIYSLYENGTKFKNIQICGIFKYVETVQKHFE